MRSVAEENYLKETYALQLEHTRVTTSMLADRVGHSAPTVTGMVKKLAGRKWVIYEPYQGVTLTKSGKAAALEVIRHHRLLETYLTRALGVPWDRVHEEAEKLEHVLSEYLEGLIDEHLGYPASDPHGSPIPTRDGSIKEPERLRLSDLPAGSFAQVVEVGDREPGLLTRLGEMRLGLKTRLRVLEVEPIDGLITIRVAGQNHVLGRTTASQINVRKLTGEREV
ncbi:MAG: metal-dependent transcriptional regulator [Spirochaetia bacterium]|jgi:DtxR family Mn-dependent transcriptional regulator